MSVLAFDENWTFSQRHMKQVMKILRYNAKNFIAIDEATIEQDTQESTDLVVLKADIGSIAVRVRRNDCRFRDLTIRATTQYGGKTELAKMREGWCQWYFYGWECDAGYIHQWMLIDLDRFRDSGILFEERRVIKNSDGTGFVSFGIEELVKCDALVRYERLEI